MRRTLVNQISEMAGKIVKLSGWVNVRRDHGKLIFIDLRDRTGAVQIVVIPDKEAAYKIAKELKSEFIIEAEGLVKERPGGAKNEKSQAGNFELEAENIRVISRPEGDLPLDISKSELDANLDTLLDLRNLTLRHKKVSAIFRVYDQVLKSYEEVMREEGFLEIKTPKILEAATEGGANFFKINYFDRSAYLAQSPQFYKQAGAGVFERVFEIGSVFRAEPHFTSRHVNEFIGIDAEMAFIESFEEIMAELEKVMKRIFSDVARNCREELALFGAEIPAPEKFPRMKLAEVLEILEKECGKKTEGMDLDSEGEKLIGEYVKEKTGSDFLFITHYPAKLRPVYSFPSAENPKFTDTFDLMYRGVEMASGGQRIHQYQALVKNMKKRGLEPESFESYLQVFKFGIPPHGGWGLGSERIVQKMLGLANIKEVILFPRDVKRLTP